MHRRLIDHIASILVVAAIFVVLVFLTRRREAEQLPAASPRIARYLSLDSVDFGAPLDRAAFQDALDAFFPDSIARNESLLREIDAYRQMQFTNRLLKTGAEVRGMTGAKAEKLGGMYIRFVAVYVVVIVLTFLGAQILGIYRFVRMRQHALATAGAGDQHGDHRSRSSSSAGTPPLIRGVFAFIRVILVSIASAVLFAPAYVIAYALRTTFVIDSYLFMVFLGVLSNGLLVNYANRFFTLLIHEQRQGYVETATVKNLLTSYTWGGKHGLPFRSVVFPWTLAPSHVFHHILLNARYQFLPTLKEHASYLISGLIIIEMALNIQGHLCYELLQNVLYRDYEVVLFIMLGIFLVVKATEIVVDTLTYRAARMYGNPGDLHHG